MLLGRVVTLRVIVQPLLWYTSSVTRISPVVVTEGKVTVRVLFIQEPLSTETLLFCHTLQLCSLHDEITVVWTWHTFQRWFTPAFSLFLEPLFGGGQFCFVCTNSAKFYGEGALDRPHKTSGLGRCRHDTPWCRIPVLLLQSRWRQWRCLTSLLSP